MDWNARMFRPICKAMKIDRDLFSLQQHPPPPPPCPSNYSRTHTPRSHKTNCCFSLHQASLKPSLPKSRHYHCFRPTNTETNPYSIPSYLITQKSSPASTRLHLTKAQH